MNFRKLVNRRIRKEKHGVNIVGDIDAVVSANVGEPGSSGVSSRRRTRIVQRSGRTDVYESDEERHERKEGGP